MTLDFDNESVVGDVACPKCGKVASIPEELLAEVRQLFREKGLL